MKLTNFKLSLLNLGAVARAAGGKAAAADLEKIVEVLDKPGDDTTSAADFLKTLETRINASIADKRSQYIQDLHQAEGHAEKFERILQELSADCVMTKADIDIIAHGYTDGRKSWRSRAAGVEAIRTKFIERAYQESKMRIIRRYKVA
jgi:hypothetical protein